MTNISLGIAFFFTSVLNFCFAAPEPRNSQGVPLIAAATAPAEAQFQTYMTTPVRRPDGAKWRLGYVDSGDYEEYPRTLKVIVKGLQELGWLSVPDIPKNLDSKQLWNYLTENVSSDYLEFVKDAWWQPGNFDESARPKVREAIMARISTQNDIDLMIAMGTWAGQDMAALGAPIPTIVASVSDAVEAHIVRSAKDSGLDNLHARVAPQRYQRQLRLFHEVIPFRRLGVVYENSEVGRTYGAVNAVTEVSKQLGFEVVPCYAQAAGVAPEAATKNVLDCYRRLAKIIDAAYITVHRGLTKEAVKKVAQILRDARIPSFSMLGAQEVEEGILLSLSGANSAYVGLFYAETIARIFNGAKPRQLKQIWIDPPKLALNLRTARAIGFDPPVEVLLAADEVFGED